MLKAHKLPLIALMLTWGLYFVALFSRMLFYENGSVFVGHEHAWSDWPLHIAISSIFAYQPMELWFEHHPMYAHGGLRYTFLNNLISGMLLKAGLSLELAFALPAILFALLLIVGIYTLFYLVLHSKKQAFAVVFVFFLSSGLGFFDFLVHLWSADSLASLLYPEKMYSRMPEYGWHSGNIIAGFLVPQRSALPGFTLGVWVLAILIFSLFHKTQPSGKYPLLILAGCLAGIMPLAHMHSFLAIVMISGLLCLYALSQRQQRWLWCWFAIPAALISCSLYLIFFYSSGSLQGFMTYFPGWEAKGDIGKWLLMWLKLWGVMLPLALIGFYQTRKHPRWISVFFLSFFLIFALSNLFLFQPVSWDNSKLFFWAYLGFCGLAVSVLAKAWQRHTLTFGRADVLLLAFVLTFTGVLEIIRIQRIDRNQWHIASAADIALGQEIRKNTPPNSVFLTSTYVHQFVMVWGTRPIIMGFMGWMANFGFDYRERQQDMTTMFQGKAGAEALLKQYKISYVVIGRSEVNEFKADEAYFKRRYPVAFQNESYRIYDVRKVGLAK